LGTENKNEEICMNLSRLFLGVLGLGWLGYGVYCLLSPEQLAGVAGVAAQTLTGRNELRAMYGGVQCAIGLSALYGAMQPAWSRWALQIQALICAGLAPTRIVSMLATRDTSSYTIGACGFELSCLVLALLLLRRSA
jgi:hypothetical protein